MTATQISDLTQFVRENEAEFDRIFGTVENKIDRAIDPQAKKLKAFLDSKIGVAMLTFLKVSNRRCLLDSKPDQGGVTELFLTPDGFEKVWTNGHAPFGFLKDKTGCGGAVYYLCDKHHVTYSDFYWPFSGYVDKHKKLGELTKTLANCLERIGEVGDEAIGIVTNKFAQLAKHLR